MMSFTCFMWISLKSNKKRMSSGCFPNPTTGGAADCDSHFVQWTFDTFVYVMPCALKVLQKATKESSDKEGLSGGTVLHNWYKLYPSVW